MRFGTILSVPKRLTFSARFYFDPNSIPMWSGEAHYILYASNRENVQLVRLVFRFVVGDYQVQAQVITDTNSWWNSPWVTLTDGPHSLEFDWRASTGPGANNGGLTFWVDATEYVNFATLDNDTRLIDVVAWGAVDAIDNGTRGTYYFDAFVSRRSTYVGSDPGAPSPPPPPAKPDALFSDGFESGNFSAWSSYATDGGDLSVSGGAALVGSYGMQAVLDDNNAIYVTDWSPWDETRYRARFYFDPNSISMASGNAHYLLYTANRDYALSIRVEFRFYSGAYQVRAEVGNDSNGWSSSAWTTISDAPHYFELDWRASTAPGANNGGMTWWIDGSQHAGPASPQPEGILKPSPPTLLGDQPRAW